jgi:polyisoprenoid-binding protein YceI
MSIDRWEIDPTHSQIQFTVRHLVVARVRGVFERWRGVIDFDRADPTGSRVSAEIEASSIDTREPSRDEHLRSADFLDVSRFPLLTFESRRIEALGANRYRVIGELSMHGVAKEVHLEVDVLGSGTDPWGKERLGFHARGALDRRDFGLHWNRVLEGGGVLVGEKIDVELDIEAVKAKAAVNAA